MIQIKPFNPNEPQVQSCLAQIMMAAPVKNLTEEEVLSTLRLIELEDLLRDTQRISRFSVTVYQDDNRLTLTSPEDKFMALLLDAECRNIILTTKRCRYCFGQTTYYWQKIARKSPLTAVKSMMLDGDGGGRYYGKGWVLAPNIQTLKKWIIENQLNLKNQ